MADEITTYEAVPGFAEWIRAAGHSRSSLARAIHADPETLKALHHPAQRGSVLRILVSHCVQFTWRQWLEAWHGGHRLKDNGLLLDNGRLAASSAEWAWKNFGLRPATVEGWALMDEASAKERLLVVAWRLRKRECPRRLMAPLEVREVCESAARIRIELGYTQKDIAKRFGVSPTVVQRWENPWIRGKPRTKVTAKMSAYLAALKQLPRNTVARRMQTKPRQRGPLRAGRVKLKTRPKPPPEMGRFERRMRARLEEGEEA